jgi:hypothetical protein
MSYYNLKFSMKVAEHIAINSQVIQQFLSCHNVLFRSLATLATESLYRWNAISCTPTKLQGVVGVLGMGGAAIRARYLLGIHTKVAMPPISTRQKSLCARCKPIITIAAAMPTLIRSRETVRKSILSNQ